MGQIAQDTINKPLIHLHECWCPHYETAVQPTLPLNSEKEGATRLKEDAKSPVSCAALCFTGHCVKRSACYINKQRSERTHDTKGAGVAMHTGL